MNTQRETHKPGDTRWRTQPGLGLGIHYPLTHTEGLPQLHKAGCKRGRLTY